MITKVLRKVSNAHFLFWWYVSYPINYAIVASNNWAERMIELREKALKEKK